MACGSQMRLAQAGRSPSNEQRVVSLRRSFRDGDRGGVREQVAAPDDEGVEGVLRVQARRKPDAAAGLALLHFRPAFMPRCPRGAGTAPYRWLGRARLRLLRRQRVRLGREILVSPGGTVGLVARDGRDVCCGCWYCRAPGGRTGSPLRRLCRPGRMSAPGVLAVGTARSAGPSRKAASSAVPTAAPGSGDQAPGSTVDGDLDQAGRVP